ncbi:MAG TPA: hypothetical protein VJ972_08160 [Anaerolineales bacterium]|nr:hypothetical protein [Anaerolineales bacterium]
MKRLISFVLLLSFLLTACSTSAAPAPSGEPVEDTPAPYPDTPSPPVIDAPIVESPSLITVRFLNSLDGWGVTEAQIVRTNDGGTSWYNVTPPDVTEVGYNVDIFVQDNDHVWVNTPSFENYPNSGFLYRTSDGGMTWTSSSTPFSRGHIKFLNESNGWALADLGIGAGSNAVAVYQTTDGGATWTQTYINDPNNANAGDTLPLGGLKFGIASPSMVSAWVYGVVYAPGTAYLYRTDNAGHIWEQVSIPLPPGAENMDLTIEQVEFVTANDAFLTMRMSSENASLALYTSNDAGNTWALTPAPIPGGGVADFMSAEEIVIYNGDQFYVTRDAARTWNIVSPDVLFGETFDVMDFVDPNTGWVVTIDPTTNHRSLYKTGDGGATWFPIVP